MMSEPSEINYDQLFDQLFDESKGISVSKIYELSDLPRPQFNRFIARWPSSSVDRREALARHMADISEENFLVDFSPFARPFMQDPASKVRLAALDMLWDSSDVSMIGPIIERMSADEDEGVRASAAATLGHYMLMIQWGEINNQHEKEIAEALLTQYNGPMTPVAVQRAALESLSSGGSPEIPQLIRQAYISRDPQMRLSAVFAMGRTADPRWTHEISTEMESDNQDMRVEAARAAGAIGSSDFVDQLGHMAKFDDHLEAQIAAIYALGQIGSDSAVKILDEISEDEEYEELIDIVSEGMDELFSLGRDLDLSLLDWEEDDFDDQNDWD